MERLAAIPAQDERVIVAPAATLAGAFGGQRPDTPFLTMPTVRRGKAGATRLFGGQIVEEVFMAGHDPKEIALNPFKSLREGVVESVRRMPDRQVDYLTFIALPFVVYGGCPRRHFRCAGLRDARRHHRPSEPTSSQTPAGALQRPQDRVSKLENGDDALVSTLRRHIGALRGELRLMVEFPDRPFIAINLYGDKPVAKSVRAIGSV